MRSRGLPPPPESIRLAIVGDVHDQWSPADESALRHLQADVVVFVGDFGNENLDIVRQVSRTRSSRAVVLGNHDAWYTATARGVERAKRRAQRGVGPTAPPPVSDLVAAQLKALGELHVGYGCLPFPRAGVAVVGCRPFSRGGGWDRVEGFYAAQYGIQTERESTDRIVAAAQSAPPDAHLVLAAHNGPLGLGGAFFDICGVDWTDSAGDFGDADLQVALSTLHTAGRHVPLLVFGHMHEALRKGGLRKRVEVDAVSRTVYLNTAVVPRVIEERQPPEEAAAGVATAEGDGAGSPCRVTLHHFCVVEMTAGVVMSARDEWVRVVPGGMNRCSTASCKPLLKTVAGEHGEVRMLWNNYLSAWEPASGLSTVVRERHTPGLAAGGESETATHADADRAAQLTNG